MSLFEANELGKAPFKIERFTAGGTHCDLCGTPIKNIYHVSSSDNQSSVIGIECIKKINQPELLRQAKAAKLETTNTEKQQKRLASEIAKFGKTKKEVIDCRRAQFDIELQTIEEQCETLVNNQPIFVHLSEQDSYFAHAILQNVESLTSCSPGQIKTVIEIETKRICKSRKGTAAYKSAYQPAKENIEALFAQLNKMAERIGRFREYAFGIVGDEGDLTFTQWQEKYFPDTV